MTYRRIHADKQTDRQTNRQTNRHTYIHTYITLPYLTLPYLTYPTLPTYLPTYLPSLSHTSFLCHTPSFTYNFVPHNCFYFSILHHLLCLSFLPRPATTFAAHYWKKLTCGVIRSFNLKGGGAKPMVFHSSRSTPPRNSIAAVGFRRGRSSQRSCAVCFLIYVYPLDISRLKCGIRRAPPPPLLEAQKTRGDIFFKCGQVKYFSEISCLALPSRVKGGDEESHIQQLVLKHRICQTSKKQNPVPQVSFCQQAAFLSETPFARQHHRIHASLGKL